MSTNFVSSGDGSAVFVAKDEATGRPAKVTIEGLEPNTNYVLSVSSAPVPASEDNDE